MSFHIPIILNMPDSRAGLYKQVPCSCVCGGDTAWVRITETGAEEMIGCICHTFAKNDKKESYPGQDYYHKHNENVKRAEENFEKRLDKHS